MNSLKKIKASGTFKRKVKTNFHKILNLSPVQCKKLLQPTHATRCENHASSTPAPEVNSRITDLVPKQDHVSPLNDSSERWKAPEHDEEEFSDPEPEDATFANLRLFSDLRSWVVKNNIRQSALKELLTILNIRLLDVLPRDPRTLLQLVQAVDIQQVENGQYWHQGVKNCIERVLSEINEPLNITLKINIDGLLVYKSSKNEFWPILFNIEEFPLVEPMIAGIYGGKQKPTNVESFLSPFVDEMERICNEGIIINGHKVTVAIRCFVCDSPARAFIKGTAYFNAQNGCQKCTTNGEYSYVSHSNYFPRTGCPQRTDEDFRNKKYGTHHKYDTLLLRLNIDMVKDFPVGDSLHLIDLGIMKKLLLGWRDGKFGSLNTKWPANVTTNLSKQLLQLRMPREIHRALRGLDCLGHWKGLGFRTFLHYVSIVVLKPILSPDVYEHFLSIFCAITICSSGNYANLLDLANLLLLHFLAHFKDFYGEDYISSNVHNLSHLVDDVKRFGILPKFSAYPFENKLFQIKNLILSGRNSLSQIVKRLSELTQISKNIDLSNGNEDLPPVLKKEIIDFDADNTEPFFDNETRAFGQVDFKDYMLGSDFTNQWFLTKSNKVVAMHFAIQNSNEQIKIKGNCLKQLNSFFMTPIESSVLYIYRSIRSKTFVEYYDLSDIKCKMVAIPINDTGNTVLIPLLHTLLY